MSAEVLRRAASLMREDWAVAEDMEGITLTDPHWRRAKTWLAVADLLDATIKEHDGPDCYDAHSLCPEARAALAVARTYLGEQP